MADIDNELWKIHYKRWGKPPPGQPGYLVITPSRIAYAFAGDHLDTRRAKKFRIGGEIIPEFGFYLSSKYLAWKWVWSSRKRKYVKGYMEMRWTTHQRFRAYDLRTPYFSEWFTPEALAELRELWASVSRLYLIVVPDPPKESRDKSELKPGLPPPGWVKEQQQSIKKQLKEAGSKAKRREMPDRTEVWQKDTTGQWWMIVTVNFDAEGKERSSVPIPLREGEPPEQLMARVKAATQKAYVKHAGQSGRETHRAGAEVGARSQERVVARARNACASRSPAKKIFPIS